MPLCDSMLLDMHGAFAGKWTAASCLYGAPKSVSINRLCIAIRFALRPAAKLGLSAAAKLGLVDGAFVIIVVDLIGYRGVLLVQLLDHLLEVSVDARSQVLLV